MVESQRVKAGSGKCIERVSIICVEIIGRLSTKSVEVDNISLHVGRLWSERLYKHLKQEIGNWKPWLGTINHNVKVNKNLKFLDLRMTRVISKFEI